MMDAGKLLWRTEQGVLQSWSLRAGLNTIGSTETNDIVVSAQGVAESHAQINWKQGSCHLKVLADSICIYNDALLKPCTEVQLHYHDNFRIGGLVFIYARSDDSHILAKPLNDANLLERWEEGIWAVSPEIIRRREYLAGRPMLPWDEIIVGHPAPYKNLTHEPSEYLQYLPPHYQDGKNDLVNNLLLAFELILKPIEYMIDQIDSYFNPWLTPEELLPWLASWVAMALDPALPLARQRALIANAAELYRLRGTAKGLSTYLQLYTSSKTIIIEPGEDSHDAKALAPDCFHVKLCVQAKAFNLEHIHAYMPHQQLIEERIRSVIEAEKPAHTRYLLSLSFE